MPPSDDDNRRELKAAFHKAEVNTYERARDEAKYHASLLLKMVTEQGGLARDITDTAGRGSPEVSLRLSQGYPPMRGHRSGGRISAMKKKIMTASGALLAICMLVTGCGAEDLEKASERDVVSYDVEDQVAKLDVRGRAGDITVVEKDRTGIRVVETLRWSRDKPKTAHRVEGDALVVSYVCESDGQACGVDYQVEVPKGLHVKVDNRSGDVTLRALSGVVEAATSSGDITAGELGGRRFVGEAGSGDIELRYVAEPDEVTVETARGSVTVYVPGGVYDVAAEAVAGKVEVQVPDNSASKHRISITSALGDVEVLPA